MLTKQCETCRSCKGDLPLKVNELSMDVGKRRNSIKVH